MRENRFLPSSSNGIVLLQKFVIASGGGYDYSVPGSAQGTYTTLKVIGDKKGDASAHLLANHPELFEQLAEMTEGLQLHVIHHVRNPYDNISTIARKSDLSLGEAIRKYFKLASHVHNHLNRFEQIPHAATIETHHEDLIADPKKSLARIAKFLNLSSGADYLEACADMIFDSPHRSRDKVEWTPELKTKVADRIRSYPFLAGYSFDHRSREAS